MTKEVDYQRLSDKILEALKMSVGQGDETISNLLIPALEMSMTRSAGGVDFVERRNFSEEVSKLLDQLSDLQE